MDLPHTEMIAIPYLGHKLPKHWTGFILRTKPADPCHIDRKLMRVFEGITSAQAKIKYP